MSSTRWILYVGNDARGGGRDFCRGSRACLAALDNLELDNMVTVQDCDSLRDEGVAFPDWLVGTPILIDRNTMTRYAGTDAVVQLTSIRPPPKPKAAVNTPVAVPSAPVRVERREEPPARRRDDDDDESAADDTFGFNPISDIQPDEPSRGRITENDVNKLIDERKRMDAMHQQQRAAS